MSTVCVAIDETRSGSGPTAQAGRECLGKDELYGLFACRAHERGLALCLWRDRSAFPRLIGFDVDALLPRADWSALLSMLSAELPLAGWQLLMCVRRGHLLQLLLARHDARPGDDDGFLQLDMHSELTVGGLPYADVSALLQNAVTEHGLRWLADTDAAVTTYLEKAIADGDLKPRYVDAFARARQKDPARVRMLIEGALGRRAADKFLALPAPMPGSVLRGALLRRVLSDRPLRLLRILFHKLIDGVAMYCRPPGRLWTFSGPDGSGKSTVIAEFARRVERRIALGVDLLHTRAYLIPRLAVILSPAKRAERLNVRRYERRIGFGKSLVRVIIALLDYQIGYWLKVRVCLAAGHLVVFDRYYQDIRVDPQLRGINFTERTLRRLAWLVPQGDRHVYLVAAPDVLAARKGELRRDEAEHQEAQYRRLAGDDQDSILIDTGERSVDDLARNLALILLQDLRGSDGAPRAGRVRVGALR